MHAFFKDPDFQFAVEGLLGDVQHHAADSGEVLATVMRIPNGDATAWVREWTATAERLATGGAAAAAAGHRRTAAARYLRAASYYSAASDKADATGRFTELWESHRAAWDRFVDLTDVPVERVAVPYEGTTLPGYFFRGGPDGARRRTLVHVNGSDGPVTSAWTRAAAEGTARGWNVLAFDGPGQNAALVRQGIPFRPDWENVITPVIDALVVRPDVDPARIALMGVSQGGYWAPRAAAYEHRIAAVVADPGVVDVSTTMLTQLPHLLITLLDAGEREKFDRDMGWALTLSPSTRLMMRWRMRPYGVDSAFDFFTAARRYRLTDEQIAAITCPVLATDPENERFWPGQSAQLASGGAAELVAFTAAEGADGHCEPAAPALREERIYDWLEDNVPA